jgi:hypothetical protein
LEIDKKAIRTKNRINMDLEYFPDLKNSIPKPRAQVRMMIMNEYSLNLARLKLAASLLKRRLGPGKVTGISSSPVRKKTLILAGIIFDCSEKSMPTRARNIIGLY